MTQTAGSLRNRKSIGHADAPQPVPVPETHPVQPVSPYGVSKLAAEMLVQQICAESGIDAAVLRLFNTYGTGQALSPYVGVVTIFANAMLEGRANAAAAIRDFLRSISIPSYFTARFFADDVEDTKRRFKKFHPARSRNPLNRSRKRQRQEPRRSADPWVNRLVVRRTRPASRPPAPAASRLAR